MRSSASAHISGGDIHNARCIALPNAGGGAVLRKIAIEIQRVLEDDAAVVLADLDDDRGEALRAGIEPQVKRHQ